MKKLMIRICSLASLILLVASPALAGETEFKITKIDQAQRASVLLSREAIGLEFFFEADMKLSEIADDGEFGDLDLLQEGNKFSLGIAYQSGSMEYKLTAAQNPNSFDYLDQIILAQTNYSAVNTSTEFSVALATEGNSKHEVAVRTQDGFAAGRNFYLCTPYPTVPTNQYCRNTSIGAPAAVKNSILTYQNSGYLGEGQTFGYRFSVSADTESGEYAYNFPVYLYKVEGQDLALGVIFSQTHVITSNPAEDSMRMGFFISSPFEL